MFCENFGKLVSTDNVVKATSGELLQEGPVKLIQQVEIAYSFLHALSKLFHPITKFSACLDSLDSSASDRTRSFRNPLLQLEKWSLFYLQSFSANHESWFEHTVNCHPTLKNGLFVHLVAFAETVSTSCIHVRHLKLYVSQKCNTYFTLGGMNE